MIFLAAFILPQETVSPLDHKLTLTQKATSLGQMLDGIKAKTGIQFQMETGLAREIVFVRVQDKPVKQVLGELAKVCDATKHFFEWAQIDFLLLLRT